MARHLTKLWLNGLKRLIAAQAEPVPKSPRSRAKQPPATAHESRVGPRATAWAAGAWTHAQHAMPEGIGPLANPLSYGLYLPAGRTTANMPLVVMLHGCRQSIGEFAEGTRMNLLADRHGFAVLYPEQSGRAHAQRCWHWYDASERAGGAEAQAIVSLVDTLVIERDFDARRVYVAGMSAGAGLAALLAVRYPERFAAVGLHSGPVFGEARSGMAALDVMRRGAHTDPVALIDAEIDLASYPGMPALVVQGEDDRVVAPVNGEQLATQFLRLNQLVDANGALQDSETRTEQRDGAQIVDYFRDERCVMRLCRVPGLGHAWSGGDDTVPFHAAVGPDASALFWDFFARQRRSGRGTAGLRSAGGVVRAG